MHARLSFCLSAMLLGRLPSAGAQTAENASLAVPPAVFTSPGPAVLAYAQQAGLALEGVAGRHDGSARPGDGVVVLASFFDGEKPRQWLVRFTGAELNDEEKKQPVDEGMVLYTTTGRVFRFATGRVALALETIGPFAITGGAAGDPPVKRARAVVNEEFLALGLHRVSALFETFRAFQEGVGKGETYHYNVGGAPFSADTVAAGQKLAERMGLTEEAERAFAGSLPALMEFFRIAKETPGISDILYAILEKPSVWAMAKALATRNVSANFSFGNDGMGPVEAGPWRLGLAEVNAVPLGLQLFGKPSLDFTLYAAESAPPLRTSAGIVGLVAKSPRNPARFLVLRVLSAQGAPTAANATGKAP